MTDEQDVMHQNSLKKVHQLEVGHDEQGSADASLQDADRPRFVVPDETLAMVFSHLPLEDRCQLRLVSKQWRRCAFFVIPYLEVELSGRYDNIYLRVNDGLTFYTLQAIGQVQSAALLERFRGSKIEHVEFQLCNESFNEELLRLMAEMAKGSYRVDVSYVTPIDYRGSFTGIRSQPPPLSDFFSLCQVLGPHITRMYFSTNEDMTRFSAEMFHDILSNLKKLKAIKHQTLGLLLPFQGMVPNDCFEQLEEADIWDFKYQCSSARAAWQGFVDRFHNQLIILSITTTEWGFPHLEEAIISGIRRFVHLEYLSLHHATWTHSKLRCFVPLLRELATACPRLTTFHLRWGWKRVAPDTIKCLFVAISEISQLQSVNLCLDFKMKQRCDELSILKMVRNVAATNFCRDLKIEQLRFPVLRVSGTMGLFLNDNAPTWFEMEEWIDFPKRCEIYYI